MCRQMKSILTTENKNSKQSEFMVFIASIVNQKGNLLNQKVHVSIEMIEQWQK